MNVLANRVASVIAHKWTRVAIQLELDMADINIIQSNVQDTFARFMAVMYRWKGTLSKPFTWETLVTALRSESVKEIRLARELECDFC